MGEGIGAILPMAVGVAIIPIPMIAVILLMFTARGRTNGPVFALGWFSGLFIVTSAAYLLADSQDAGSDSETSDIVFLVKALLGVLLLFLALKQWRSRPKHGEIPEQPKWMQSLEQITPGKTARLALLGSGVTPKNLALSIAAGTTIAQLGIESPGSWGTVIVYSLLASTTVAGPVVYAFVAGKSGERNLRELKDWLEQNNAVLMFVVLIVFGAVLLGNGVQGLFA